jgi:cellobiose phosphorylase
MLANPYGYFDSNQHNAYVIKNPETPMPWINVLTNGDYGMTISQSGGGYSWRVNANLNRITRWEQDLIRDEWGKFFYIRDSQSGAFWSPTLQPCGRALSNVRVTHGLGFTRFEAQYGDLYMRLECFVPLDAPCELWQLTIHNQGESPRQLDVYTYFEWLLGVAPDWHREFHRTFIETDYDQQHGVILARKRLWELPAPTHWNRDWEYVAFHSASLVPKGFETDKRAFLGRHGHLSAPLAVQHGQLSGQYGKWGDPIGALQVAIDLSPDEARTVVFVIGAANSHDEALQISERFKSLAAVEAAYQATTDYWQTLVGQLQVETPDPAVNIMANTWLSYQAIAGRLYGRTAYYQTGGAYGFRDQLQDSLVWLLLGLPEKTLDQIKLHAAHQFQDGSVLHWWLPLAETGQHSEYSDDLLWLPFVVIRYLWETEDYKALELDIPFFDGGSASLAEHCLRAFRLVLSRRSSRGLPLILKADWNDGMNAVGAQGRGESVWMAHFLHQLLCDWAALPTTEAQLRTTFLSEAAALREAVNRYAWDGAWYWRATTDSGRVLGAQSCAEGRIFLNANTWAILSGTATAERAAQAMRAVREQLYTPYGALLLAPAYTQPDPEIGYLTRYAPGVRENGGVYCHAACWAVLAERLANGVEAAYQLWRSFCPPVRAAEDADLWMAEPYVMPGNINGPLAQRPGQAGWTWYTGSAAWSLRALIEGVLGVVVDGSGLRVKAALPQAWDSFRLIRRYRGAIYRITVRRGAASACTVDGKVWQAETLPIAPQGAIVDVDIVVSR